jgi:hypothetical protein
VRKKTHEKPPSFALLIATLLLKKPPRHAHQFPKKKHTHLIMGKSTLLATTLGLLAIGANAGAVDLTESDFDAQVFESGKVRAR